MTLHREIIGTICLMITTAIVMTMILNLFNTDTLGQTIRMFFTETWYLTPILFLSCIGMRWGFKNKTI